MSATVLIAPVIGILSLLEYLTHDLPVERTAWPVDSTLDNIFLKAGHDSPYRSVYLIHYWQVPVRRSSFLALLIQLAFLSIRAVFLSTFSTASFGFI